MKNAQKITAELPKDLIKRAIQASGENLTATLRMGLELIAAKLAYQGVKNLRGKVKFSTSLADLKRDRS